MLPLPPTLPEDGSPVTHEPKNERLTQFEKHRIRVSGGEAIVSLYPMEDPSNPIVLESWTDPEFRTLRCKGVTKMLITWVSGTPRVSGCKL